MHIYGRSQTLFQSHHSASFFTELQQHTIFISVKHLFSQFNSIENIENILFNIKNYRKKNKAHRMKKKLTRSVWLS